MPETPDAAQDYARPKRGKLSLEKRLSKATPAKLLDGAEKQGQPNGREDLIPGCEGERLSNGAFDSCPGINDHRNTQDDECPPRGWRLPQGQALKETS